MKRSKIAIFAVFMGLVMISVPIVSTVSVFAASGSCTPTSIIGGKKCKKNDAGELVEDGGGTINCSCDNGTGSETKQILQLVVTIMTMGVGILAVLGITVVGIQYLTAGGSEEKTRKAKRRMFEIVIGLVAYVIIYAVLHWLIPDFSVSF